MSWAIADVLVASLPYSDPAAGWPCAPHPANDNWRHCGAAGDAPTLCSQYEHPNNRSVHHWVATQQSRGNTSAAKSGSRNSAEWAADRLARIGARLARAAHHQFRSALTSGAGSSPPRLSRFPRRIHDLPVKAAFRLGPLPPCIPSEPSRDLVRIVALLQLVRHAVRLAVLVGKQNRASSCLARCSSGAPC